MSEENFHNDDEIDLSELSAFLWSHKILIIIVTGISIFLSGLYALTVEKKFTASAVFDIEQNSSRGMNLSGDLGALASLAGFAAPAAQALVFY